MASLQEVTAAGCGRRANPWLQNLPECHVGPACSVCIARSLYSTTSPTKAGAKPDDCSTAVPAVSISISGSVSPLQWWNGRLPGGVPLTRCRFHGVFARTAPQLFLAVCFKFRSVFDTKCLYTDWKWMWCGKFVSATGRTHPLHTHPLVFPPTACGCGICMVARPPRGAPAERGSGGAGGRGRAGRRCRLPETVKKKAVEEMSALAPQWATRRTWGRPGGSLSHKAAGGGPHTPAGPPSRQPMLTTAGGASSPRRPPILPPPPPPSPSPLPPDPFWLPLATVHPSPLSTATSSCRPGSQMGLPRAAAATPRRRRGGRPSPIAAASRTRVYSRPRPPAGWPPSAPPHPPARPFRPPPPPPLLVQVEGCRQAPPPWHTVPPCSHIGPPYFHFGPPQYLLCPFQAAAAARTAAVSTALPRCGNSFLPPKEVAAGVGGGRHRGVAEISLRKGGSSKGGGVLLGGELGGRGQKGEQARSTPVGEPDERGE